MGKTRRRLPCLISAVNLPLSARSSSTNATITCMDQDPHQSLEPTEHLRMMVFGRFKGGPVRGFVRPGIIVHGPVPTSTRFSACFRPDSAGRPMLRPRG
jgi:hypothetical protein